MEHEVLDALQVSPKYTSQKSAHWKHTHRIGGQY